MSEEIALTGSNTEEMLDAEVEAEFKDSVSKLQADAKIRIARVTRTAHILHFAAHNLIFVTILLAVFSLTALFAGNIVALLVAISISIPVSSIKKDDLLNPIIEELSSLIHSNDVEIIQSNSKQIEVLVKAHFNVDEDSEEELAV